MIDPDKSCQDAGKVGPGTHANPGVSSYKQDPPEAPGGMPGCNPPGFAASLE
jgi:hypothetical protein